MYKTKHLMSRMNQRGITQDMIQILLDFGICNDDKIFLSKKSCIQLSEYLKKTKKIVDKMSEKGGYILINEDEALITSYRIASFNSKLAKKKDY